MKSLILLMALILSSNAFATKARMQALGQNEIDDGSFYIQDDRRVFQNAAVVNDLAGSVIVEIGDATKSTGMASYSLNTDVDPEPEGGVFVKHGDMVYGVHLGYESNLGSLLRNLAGAKTPKLDNTLQLMVGGKSSIDWGASLLYSQYTTSVTGSQDVEFSTYAARIGARADKWELWANLGLGAESDDPTASPSAKFEGSLGLWLGGTYKVSDMNTAWISYKSFGWDQETSNNTYRAEGSYSTLEVGMGHEHEVTKGGKVFIDAELYALTVELDFNRGLTNTTELKYTRIPLNFGYEHAVTDWLTLRGSVTHNLYGKAESENLSNLDTIDSSTILKNIITGSFPGASTTDGEATIPNSTKVAGGASLTFGDVQIDGVLGVNSSGTENGSLRLDRLFTRASMIYRF